MFVFLLLFLEGATKRGRGCVCVVAFAFLAVVDIDGTWSCVFVVLGVGLGCSFVESAVSANTVFLWRGEHVPLQKRGASK